MHFLKMIENFFLAYVSGLKEVAAKVTDKAEQAEHQHQLALKATWYGGITCGLLILAFVLFLFGILAIFLNGWIVAFVYTGIALTVLGVAILFSKLKITASGLLISGLLTTGIATTVMLIPKGLGTPIAFLTAGLFSLLASYLMLTSAKVAFSGALIMLTLTKNVLVDSQIALAENIYAAVANTAAWTGNSLKQMIRMVAAAVPGVNLAEVEGAMSQQPEYKTGKNILEKAELTVEKLEQEAKNLFAGIRKFYLITAGFIFLVLFEVIGIKLGNNAVVALLNHPAIITFILLLTLIIAWKTAEEGTLRPLFKWVVAPLLAIVLLVVFVDKYFFPMGAMLARNKGGTELSRGHNEYEKDILADWQDLVKAREDTIAYVTHIDSDGIGRIDTSTRILKEQLVPLQHRITAGERWMLINKHVYAYAGADSQRFIHISHGLNKERIEVLASPEFFEAVTAKDRKKQSPSRPMPKKDNGFPLPLTFLSTKQVAPNIWEVVLPANVGNGRTGIKVPPNSKLTIIVSGTTNPAGMSSKLDGANQDTDARGIVASWRGQRTSVISWPYDNARTPNNLGVIAYRLGENSYWNGVLSGSNVVSYSDQEEILDLAYNDDFTDKGQFRPDFFNDNYGHYVVQVKLN